LLLLLLLARGLVQAAGCSQQGLHVSPTWVHSAVILAGYIYTRLC